MSNTKYKRVRTRILLLPLLILFLAFIILKFLLPAYLVQEKDLDKDRGIIQDVFKNGYPTLNKVNRIVYKSCIDIILADKPYFIRLSDHWDDSYWPLINNPVNISKPIEERFQSRLLHGGILYNPNQISIGNQIIIPYNSNQTVIGWFILALMLAIIVCIYFTYSFIRIYKTKLYESDKIIGQESKWKLLLEWLTD